MRLPIDSAPLKDIRSILDVGFLNTDLPSEDELQRAWADPRVQGLLKGDAPELGQLLQSVAVEAFAQVQGLVGLNVGIPTNLINHFSRSISHAALQDGADNWVQFATSTTSAIADIAVQDMGQIPIVGWIAQLVYTVVKVIVTAATGHQPKPALLRYSKETDQHQARQALQLLEGNDWTNLFMPAWTGSWKRYEGSDGNVFHPRDPANGYGCLPGGATGYVTTQCFHKGPCPEDTWDQTPSVARVCTAAWSAISTNDTASVFNVWPEGWYFGWHDFFEQGLYWARHPPPGPVGGLEEHLSKASIPLAVPKHSGAPLRGGDTSLCAETSKDPGMKVWNVVCRWTSFVSGRQFDMLDTVVCAYASEKQVAFQKKPALLNRLHDRRKHLLVSSDLARVHLDDVVDADFRDAVKAATLKQASGAPLRGKPLRTPNMAPVGFRNGSGAMMFVAASLAAGLGYWIWKTR